MNAADLIRRFEGRRLQAYLDEAHVPTIGYGFTRRLVTTDQIVLMGLMISAETCEAELQRRVADLERDVLRLAQKAGPDQLSALISFVYNVGLDAFRTSTLLRKHAAGDYDGAANEFRHWVWVTDRASGEKRISNALEHRRFYERSTYLGEEPTPTPTPRSKESP